MPKPPHFFQTHYESCVPTCIRMILASFNFEISEFDLRNLCRCDSDGTLPSYAVKAVIECGFDVYQANLVFEELENLISQNITPIVFIRFDANVNYSHAVVVYEISKGEIYVLDPEIGERKIEMNQFAEIWSRGLTIVIEDKK